jgi:hypothetical protein
MTWTAGYHDSLNYHDETEGVSDEGALAWLLGDLTS